MVVIVNTSWYIRYSILTSGYRPPSLIYYSFWRARVFALALPYFRNGGYPWKFADISFVSWDPSYIRSSRHFKLLWAWLILLRHLRHHKRCDWALDENRIKKFQSLPKIQAFAAPPPRFTLQKSGGCSRVKRSNCQQVYFAQRRNKHPAIASHCDSCASCYLRRPVFI